MNKKRSSLCLFFITTALVILLIGCRPAHIADSPSQTALIDEQGGISTLLRLTDIPATSPPEAGSPAETAVVPHFTPLPPATDPLIDPAMEPLIEKAKKDLADRLGIAEVEIEVLEARAVVWPDAAMGCPQPGMVYIQILFDGGLIILKTGDQIYNYHSGGGEGPFLCEQGGK